MNPSKSYRIRTTEDENTAIIEVRPPFGIDWTIRDFLNGAAVNMAVSASPGSPQLFTVTPAANEIIFISAITMYIGEVGSLAFDKFANGSILTNGIELEGQSLGNSFGPNITLVSNPNLACTFLNGSPISGGNAFYGEMLLSAGREMTLDGSQGDFLTWRVQDDTTGATFMQSSLKAWVKQ